MMTLLEGVLAVYNQEGVFKCEGVKHPTQGVYIKP